LFYAEIIIQNKDLRNISQYYLQVGQFLLARAHIPWEEYGVKMGHF